MHPKTRLLVLKCTTVAILSLTLCGCLGGTIAQQLARSILMQGADSITTAAWDAQARNEKQMIQNTPLKDTPPDPYHIAFLRSGFEPIQPQIEPLPEAPIEIVNPIQIMQETKLVNVEVWNLLIGEEKQLALEKARLQGSTLIPPKAEWSQWQIAVGANKSNQSKPQPITFLIPPSIGKMHSGTKALVELSDTEELSIARYALN